MKGRNGALAADFFNFGTDIFPLKIPFKKRFEIVVLLLWRRDPVLELQIVAVVCILLCFATQCLQIALEWLREGSSLRQLHA